MLGIVKSMDWQKGEAAAGASGVAMLSGYGDNAFFPCDTIKTRNSPQNVHTFAVRLFRFVLFLYIAGQLHENNTSQNAIGCIQLISRIAGTAFVVCNGDGDALIKKTFSLKIANGLQ